MHHSNIDEFSAATALSVLLTTESLLFAVFALAVNLAEPSARPRRWLLPAGWIVALSVIGLAGVAFGAGTAWYEIFLDGGFPHAWTERVIAIAIVGAIAAQPVMAFFLAMGLRPKTDRQ